MESDEYDSDNELPFGRSKVRFYTMIVLDTGPSMFIKTEHDTILFTECLQVLVQLLDDLLLAKENNLAILFTDNNAEKSQILDLKQPIVETYKLLEKLTLLPSNEIKREYERVGDLDMSDFLLMCKKKLSPSAYKKTLIYITNDDEPVKEGDAQKVHVLKKEIESLKLLGINFHLITLSDNFKYEKIYKTVLHEKNYFNVITDLNELLAMLTNELRSSTIRFKFYPIKGDWMKSFTVVIGNFLTKGTILKNVSVTRDSHKPVKKIMVSQSVPGDDVEYEDFVLNYAKFENPIKFDKQEIKTIFNDYPCGFMLLCVSNRITDLGECYSSFKLIQNHPNEKNPLFDIFWTYCAQKSKVLVCLVKYRKGFKVNFIELIPKIVNKKKVFVGVTIPHANHLKYLQNSNGDKNDLLAAAAPDDGITSKIVEKLSFNYDPALFSQPKLAREEAYIRSQLLETKLDLPDNTYGEKIDEVIGSESEMYNLFYPKEGKSTKRKASAKTTSASKRKGM